MIELNDTSASAIAERFKALGEPMRLLLLEALRGGECSVGEVAPSCHGVQPTSVFSFVIGGGAILTNAGNRA